MLDYLKDTSDTQGQSSHLPATDPILAVSMGHAAVGSDPCHADGPDISGLRTHGMLHSVLGCPCGHNREVRCNPGAVRPLCSASQFHKPLKL